MAFVIRTAKQDRQLQLEALHAAHAHVEGYVAAPDDSDHERYQGHWFVTNQEAYEHKSNTVRVTCPTEACAKQCAAILNDAAEQGGCWYDKKELVGTGCNQREKVTRTWAPWWPGTLPPPQLMQHHVHKVLGPAWSAHAKARTAPPAPPAPKAA